MGLLLILALAGVLVMAVAIRQASSVPQPATPVAASSSKLNARGEVRPVAQARVGTIAGGTLNRLVVETGDPVAEGQEIGRVLGANGIEIVTAPFSGTITAVLAHFGDTLGPGAAIVALGDLSRLRVETTDVDEFIVATVHRGQSAVVRIEALDRELAGAVRSVSLESITNATVDRHYPVTIELADTPSELRPGMTARITFAE